MKPITMISTAALSGTLLVNALAAPAQAYPAPTPATATVTTADAQSGSTSTLYGSCNTKSKYGTFQAYYAVRNGGMRFFYQVNWNIRGNALGRKNNVRIRIRQDLMWRRDRTLKIWSSKDNIPPGSGSYSPTWIIPAGKRIHVDVQFIFDISGVDPSCTARSASI